MSEQTPVNAPLAEDDKLIEKLQQLSVVLSDTVTLIENTKKHVDSTVNNAKSAKVERDVMFETQKPAVETNVNPETEKLAETSVNLETIESNSKPETDKPAEKTSSKKPDNCTCPVCTFDFDAKNINEIPVKEGASIGEPKQAVEKTDDKPVLEILKNTGKSADTLVVEPQYEIEHPAGDTSISNAKDCGCQTKDRKSESFAKDPILQTEPECIPENAVLQDRGLTVDTVDDTLIDPCGCKSKSRLKDSKQIKSKNRKQLADKLSKEKAEKLSKLKENIVTAQKYLADIQEQIRQIERLNTDFDIMNTPEGQVNSAALYKEIMKPQSVPYVPQTLPITSTPQMQTSCTCCTSQLISSQLPSDRSQLYRKNQEKVAVLSAVPLDEAYL